MKDIDILVNGKSVQQFAHEGKTYIIAKPGTQYEIRIKNNSANRIMAVASVDGLSVVDGELASPEGPGYVISGYSSYTVKGWRTSNDNVRLFEFSNKEQSYAAKSENGDTRNVGVIGVVIHAEKSPKIEKEYIPYTVPYPVYPYRRPYYPYEYSEPWKYYCSGTTGTYTCTSSLGNTVTDAGMLRSANFMSQCDSAPVEFDLGTKFSQTSLEDKVTNTEFQSSHIIRKTEIYYASEEQLKLMGVRLDKKSEVAFPEAFSVGFCRVPGE